MFINVLPLEYQLHLFCEHAIKNKKPGVESFKFNTRL